MTLYDTNHKLFILFFRVALYFPYFFPVWLGLVSSFNDEIGITGAILTKLDGDSRGGAALSIKEASWLTKLLRIFLFYRFIKKLLIHYNTTHLIGPINGRYTITSLDLIFIFYVFTCLWYTQRKRYDDPLYMKGSNTQIIKLTFISCFLLPSFLVYEQPTNLQVSGKPIKFVGQGERVEDLEPFYPDRMAQRILEWEMYSHLLKKHKW